MAVAVTGKRKRQDGATPAKPIKKAARASTNNGEKHVKSRPDRPSGTRRSPDNQSVNGAEGPGAVRTALPSRVHVQIVTGSYERVLHGFSASIPPSHFSRDNAPAASSTTSEGDPEPVTFAETFLFAAHNSAIRCLALSPPADADKCLLATGSSDERVNVYSLSTVPPSRDAKPGLPGLMGNITAENPRNRSLGSLMHHDRAITRLQFPAKSKLFSAAEDATIAISRTRDWTVLSSIKAPIPKPQGRPSGDTAGPGEIPAGVNDFAVHPSQKLMLSVGRGERCMRLWNLMTGKKAGVLNLDRQLLVQAGVGKFDSGEGRQVLWDPAGENYVVGFERGAAMFGIDSKPKAIVRPSPSTKIHKMRFLPTAWGSRVVALATEDGRILFYDLDALPEQGEGDQLPKCPCTAQLGGAAAGITGRFKDFDILELPPVSAQNRAALLFVTASSDGAVRLWTISDNDLALSTNPESGDASDSSKSPRDIGLLVATHETGDRITCLGSFVLDGKAGTGTGDDDFEGFDDEQESEEEKEEEEDEQSKE